MQDERTLTLECRRLGEGGDGGGGELVVDAQEEDREEGVEFVEGGDPFREVLLIKVLVAGVG